MAQPSKNRRNLAVIGAGVGVAVAAVVTLLVVRDKPEEAAIELSARAAALPTLPNQALEGGVVKPWETKQPTAADLAELKKAEEAEKLERAQDEAAAEKALIQAQRANEQARNADILGQKIGAFASLTGTGFSGGLATDGTGTYDMIGGGVGQGGYGVGSGRLGRSRGLATPMISIGQPTVKPAVSGGDGELDKTILRRYVKRNAQKLQHCYEKELLTKPTLQGIVQLQFTITDTGVVDNASASGVDATVSSCMASVVEGIAFPSPKGTGGIAVRYPFTVRRSPS